MTMMGNRRWVLATCAIWLGSASIAAADGDRALGPTLYERAIGLRLATAGVGLSGRLEDLTVAPITSATITLEGIPGEAEIRRAYLYWQIYGTEHDTSIELDGTPVTGVVIGTGGGTCWDETGDFDLTMEPNVSYRADVTDLVDGDGDYELTGFPSGEAMRDSQGASLVVLYVDPDETLLGTVALRDGCAEVSGGTLQVEFDELLPVSAVNGWLHMGVGDGQSIGADGSMTFADRFVPIPAGSFDHFNELTEGRWWSDNVYELTEDQLAAIAPGAGFQQLYQQDCLAFTYLALAIQSDEPAPDAGVPDGGGELDGGSSDGGRLDGGLLDGGGTDAGAIDAAARDGGSAPASVGGCGCRVGSDRRGALWLAPLALALLGRARRRRAPV